MDTLREMIRHFLTRPLHWRHHDDDTNAAVLEPVRLTRIRICS